MHVEHLSVDAVGIRRVNGIRRVIFPVLTHSPPTPS